MNNSKLNKLLGTVAQVFVIMLILAVMSIAKVNAVPDGATLTIDPPTLVVGPPVPTETFTVNVTVTDVTDLFAWQVIILWNNSTLNLTSASLPPYHVFSYATMGLEYLPFGPQTDLENAEGRAVLYGATLMGETETFNGTGVLCQLEFVGVAEGESALHIQVEEDPSPPAAFSKLEDSEGSSIEFATSDGSITVIPEFPVSLIVPLLIIVTTTAILFKKLTWPRNRLNTAEAK